MADRSIQQTKGMEAMKSKAGSHDSPYWPLFKHMFYSHGLSLTDSEMEDIYGAVLNMEARSLAIKLYEAGQKEKRKQPKEIWGDSNCTWHDLPSESVAMWDAVAICAYDVVRKKKAKP